MANRIPNCPDCGVPGLRHEKYDAYYCTDCGKWLEGPCEDQSCHFCVDRPESPMTSYNQEPLSFSDQPGYVLTYKGNLKLRSSLTDVSFDVEIAPYQGWWQTGFLRNWILGRKIAVYTRNYQGPIVWKDNANGVRACLNLETGLEKLWNKVEADAKWRARRNYELER